MSKWISLLAATAVSLSWMTGADAQSAAPPAPNQKAATSPLPSGATKSEARKKLRAAKKAERVAIRKKRAQCFDEAKKSKLTGQPQIEFIRTCTAKPN